jgi:hypothetical protein
VKSIKIYLLLTPKNSFIRCSYYQWQTFKKNKTWMKYPHSGTYKCQKSKSLCLQRSEIALLCLKGDRLRPLVLLITAIAEWCWQGRTEEIRQKPTPVPIRLQQNWQGLTRDLIQAYAVIRRRQSASTRARPNNDRNSSKLRFHYFFLNFDTAPSGSGPPSLSKLNHHAQTHHTR